MKKFPFLKCCEWLYYGALSAGILFVLLGFLQEELIAAGMFADERMLSEINVRTGAGTLAATGMFPGVEAFLGLLMVGTFAAQLLLIWSGEKGYRFQTGLGLFAVNIAIGLFLLRQPENRTAFWCYVGVEAVCIISAAVVYVIRQFLVLKGLLVFVQASALVALAVLEKHLPDWCVGVMLVAFLLFLVELATGERKEMLELMPLFMAALFLLCRLPRNEEPLDWSWVGRAWDAVQEKAEVLLVDISYLLEGENEDSFAGFDGGGLGGFVFGSEKEQLHIGGGRLKNPLYLTGAVYGEYTGKEWQTVPKQSSRIEQGQEQIWYALEQSIYAGQQEQLTSSVLLAVEYRLIRTTSLFHELYTTDLYFPDGTPLFQEDAPWIMEKAKGKDFTYQLHFLEINERCDEIKTLLRQQAWKEDAVWDKEFLQREAEIYQAYSKLPETVPQRVYELAHTIAAGADSDYDRMAAFVDYLKDYNYTKTPPECPDGQDFADYFLFDGKSGYCTSFATALAVLGRCEGIPTRYVTGFMTVKPCKSARTDVLITGNQGHAWVEAYIEHVGWVRFDATPGYGDVWTDRWTPVEAAGDGITDGADAQAQKPQGTFAQEMPLQEAENDWQGRTLQEYVLLLAELIWMLLAGSILIVAMVVWLRNMVRHRTYTRMNTQEKMRQQIERLLRLGKLRGAPIREGETLYAYRVRTQKMWAAGEYSFAEVCQLYESVRFGEKEVSAEELQMLETYVRETEREYLAECGLLRRVVYRVW